MDQGSIGEYTLESSLAEEMIAEAAQQPGGLSIIPDFGKGAQACELENHEALRTAVANAPLDCWGEAFDCVYFQRFLFNVTEVCLGTFLQI